MTSGEFISFGAAHWATVGVCAVMGALLVYLPWKHCAYRGRYWTGVGIAVFMAVQEVVDRAAHVLLGGKAVTEVLPFHLCGISVVLVVVMLITRSRALFGVVYFWGIVGASMAILTPDVAYAFPHLLNITYFSSHALIVVGVVYMLVNYGFRVQWRDLWRTVVITNLYMLFIFPLNLVLGSNYLFLREKPAGETIVDFLGPWPWYILGLEAVGLVLFAAAYMPFWLHDSMQASPMKEQEQT